MKIQTVVVKIHEKRNNPNSYGHYDSEVGYTAELDEGEDAAQVVERLQFQARQHVAIECDRWEAEVKLEGQRDAARQSLEWIMDRAEGSQITDYDEREFEKKVVVMSTEEQAEWRAKLKAAQGEFLSRIKGDLDKIVKKAGRKKLSPREISDFDDLVTHLPESERQGYIDRFHAAMDAYELSQAPQPEESATQVENTGSGDKEEMPF